MTKRNGRNLSVFSSAKLHVTSVLLAILLLSGEAAVAVVVTPFTAPLGMPRRWEAGMQVSPYSTVNLRTGRMITTLPIVGWEGRGPSISFSLYHNMTSPYGVLPIDPEGSPALMGDANGDSKVDEADIDPFAEIVLSGSQTAEQVAITDFSGDGAVTVQDFEAFGEALMLMSGGPNWRHSYSMSLFVAGHIPTLTTRATLTRDDGTQDIFVLFDDDGAGTNPEKWVAPPGVYETLVRETIGGTDGYTLTYKNQWRARFSIGGVLQWIADATTAVVQPNGQNVDLTPKNRVRCVYYDAPGQPHNLKLWKVIDAANRELVLVYNEYGKLMTVTDPINRVWTLNYEGGSCSAGACPDGDGRFLGLEDPNPAHLPIGWDYTADNEIWFIVDKNNDPYTFTYDDGRLVGVDDPLQIDQAFSYMGTENNEVLCRHYDRRGSEWKYYFQSWSFLTPTESTGQLTKTINPLGETMQFYHNDSRNPAATPPSGAPDNWYAPHRHEVTSRINGLGKQWDFAYAPAGSTTVSANPLQRGNMATADDPLDNLWTIGYDGYNNLTSVLEPDGDPGTTDDILTTIAYESSIDPTVPTIATLPPDADDETGTILLTYWDAAAYGGNANGKLRSVMDANGVETLLRYDTRGQLSRVDEGPTTGSDSWFKVFSFASRNKVGQTLTALQYGREESNGGIFETGACAGPGGCPVSGASISYDSCTCTMSISCTCGDAWIPPCPEKEDEQSCGASGGSSSQTTTGLTTGYQIPNMCEPRNLPSIMRGDTHLTRDGMGRVTQTSSSAGDESFPISGGSPVVNTTQTIDYDGLGRPTLSQLLTDEPRGGAGGGAGITRAFTYGYNDLTGTYTRTGPDGQLTTVQTDLAGRVLWTGRDSLVALYDYYPNGQVQSVSQNNGTLVVYEFDDAERLTTISHMNPSAAEPVILEMTYGYNARGLITSITEEIPGETTAVTTFTYDQRGRLLDEERTGTHVYHLSYKYDQGGNRKSKVDWINGATTTYHYDTDPDTELVDCDGDGDGDIAPTACYHTRNNRLMYYETIGATIREKVWYQYDLATSAAGNSTYIVRQVYASPFAEPDNYGYVLNYNSSGELWFISKQEWTGNVCPPEGPVTQSIHEFRTNGRNMRLTRERDPASANGGGTSSWPELPGTTQWHDFDGDEAYADSGVSVAGGGPIGFTPLAAREPGLGMKDMQTGNTSYFHGDQIGSLRAVTDTPAGVPSVTGRIVYTAFGERVWSDGTIGTRHQYAGAWGYDTSDAYASGLSPHFGGAAGDEVPFVHVGHRWYDPASGRFLQRDPIGIRGGLNVYLYVDGSPTIAVDPSGQIILPVLVGTIIGAGIDLAHSYSTIHDAEKVEGKGVRTFIENDIDCQRAETVGGPRGNVYFCGGGTSGKPRYRVIVTNGPNDTESISILDQADDRTEQWYRPKPRK